MQVMRFSANLSMLFCERPLLERFGAARAAGFHAVEVQFPYEADGAAIAEELRRHGLDLVVINGPPPNYSGGPRGFAAVPGGGARFRHDLQRAGRYARTLGTRHLHLMAGVAEGEAARAEFVENLAHAAAALPEQSLVIEPINRGDMPGYFLDDFGLAAEVIAEVGARNLRLQFDAYHAHLITGDVIGTWERVRDLVAHVQIAGAPGRHEPDSGAFDCRAFLQRIAADGYLGWVGAEYVPSGRTEAGLGWMRSLV
jgi:hydroxypyruvate isomerase